METHKKALTIIEVQGQDESLFQLFAQFYKTLSHHSHHTHYFLYATGFIISKCGLLLFPTHQMGVITKSVPSLNFKQQYCFWRYSTVLITNYQQMSIEGKREIQHVLYGFTLNQTHIHRDKQHYISLTIITQHEAGKNQIRSNLKRKIL